MRLLEKIYSKISSKDYIIKITAGKEEIERALGLIENDYFTLTKLIRKKQDEVRAVYEGDELSKTLLEVNFTLIPLYAQRNKLKEIMKVLKDYKDNKLYDRNSHS